MEFKDNFIHKQFNIMASKGKNWLPADYGRTTVNNNKSEAHQKEKVYKAPVYQTSTINKESKPEISIDSLLQTVKEISNKNEAKQLNILVERVG